MTTDEPSKRTGGSKKTGKARKPAKGTGPQRGDVLRVGYADPDKAAQLAEVMTSADPSDILFRGPRPVDDERIAVRLIGYPYLFVVRVRAGRTGPGVEHIEITADDGAAVDYESLRSIPLRRIALSAWNWLQRFGGTVGFPGDHDLQRRRPDDPDVAPRRWTGDPDLVTSRLDELVWRVQSAILSGLPVRKTVADEMKVGTATIDRLIRKAKDAGLMDGIEIPKRPGPRQRDIALRDHLLGIHLDTHGPYSDAPFDDELAEVMDRIGEREARAETTNNTTIETQNDTEHDQR